MSIDDWPEYQELMNKYNENLSRFYFAVVIAVAVAVAAVVVLYF